MDNIDTASLLIRGGIGLVMVLFGLSQLRKPEKWLKYIPKLIQFLMPVKPESFMRVHSLGNISLGLLLLTGLFQPLTIWLAIAWWIWVSPFAFYYEVTVGLRDFAIIMALVALLVLQNL
jgi:uncharacterized protein YjeT (DUF2065 family)